MPEKFELSKQLLDKLYSYLGNRPFVESAQLIDELNKEINPQIQKLQNFVTNPGVE